MSLQDFIQTPKFDEYREQFKEHYHLERRADGVLLVKVHTQGGPLQLSVQNHRSTNQLFKTIGADPQNEVMIITGTGGSFMNHVDPDGFQLEADDRQNWAYEYAYNDCRLNITSQIYDLQCLTIGVAEGPTWHPEILLMCDLTIASEDAVFFDPHFPLGFIPGDGVQACYRELIGVKRAAYAHLMGQPIDARKALEWGMVNEIVDKNRLLDKAYEIADKFMAHPRTTRRLTTAILRKPWKERIANDLDSGIATQMFGYLANATERHTKKHIEGVARKLVPGDEKNSG